MFLRLLLLLLFFLLLRLITCYYLKNFSISYIDHGNCDAINDVFKICFSKKKKNKF